MDSGRTKSAILLAAAGLALNVWIATRNTDGWGVDFNQFYAASRLAGTGQLYNWAALSALEAEHGQQVRSGRLPVVSFSEKLVAWLPYDAAHWLWLGACTVALVGFALLWPGINRAILFAALCWSMPAALLLILGQDTPFWLLSAALGFWLLERGSPRLAGVAFSLCICKYHLAVGIPILLVAQKRWSTLATGALACVAGIAASFAIEGAAWPSQYLAMIGQPLFSPAAERMPNLRGIACRLPGHTIVEAILAAALVALVWSICRRTADLRISGSVATAAGLLLAHHGYANDCALLIPLLVLTIQRKSAPQWLVVWALLLLTPLPPALLASHSPLGGQLLIVGFVLTALVWEQMRPQPYIFGAK